MRWTTEHCLCECFLLKYFNLFPGNHNHPLCPQQFSGMFTYQWSTY